MALMEQPLTIVFGGLLLAGMLFGGLIQTGKKWLLYAGIGVLLLTVGLLFLERSTITPREAVKATLYVIADDLERNDITSVLGHVSDAKMDIKGDAKKYLGYLDVIEVKIKNNLKIEIFDTGSGQIAEARFNVVFRGRAKGTMYRDFLDENRPIPQHFMVRFRLEDDGRWRVRDYERNDPRAGIGQ